MESQTAGSEVSQLEKFERPQIVQVDYAERLLRGIHHHETGDVPLLHDAQGAAGQFPQRERQRRPVHAIADHEIMANQPDGEYASANFEDCSIWRWTGKSPITFSRSVRASGTRRSSRKRAVYLDALSA